MALPPTGSGLYQPDFEHDACGVAFVVDMHGRRSHRMIEMGLASLCHMEHRGASGAESNTGDGAGILLQIPDAFYRAVVDVELPVEGAYGTGIAFLSTDDADAAVSRRAVEAIASAEGLRVAAWRPLPIDPSALGATALAAMPRFEQIFVVAADGASGMDLERRLFVARKRCEREGTGVYFPSLSGRTIVYKGMLTAPQMDGFFRDLNDERVETALTLVHSRFSPTPSRAGRWPIRFASPPTTGRSTRSGATATGCGDERRCCARR